MHQQLLQRENPDILTCLDAFFNGRKVAKDAGDDRFLGTRSGSSGSYEWITYDQVMTKATNIASGLLNLDVSAGQQTMIGIYSQNCPDWFITTIACYMQSWIIIPLYTSVSDSGVTHIVGECDLKICFVQSQKDIDRMFLLRSGWPALSRLISFTEPDRASVTRAKELGLELIFLDDLVESGSKSPRDYLPPKPDDLVNICYTSGTTGTPNGAMLTHSNLISVVSSQTVLVKAIEDVAREVSISYLPLAHILEFVIENFCAYNGYKIGYFSGDPKKLFDDIIELKPTLMPTVPRLMNRLYAEIQKKIDKRNIGTFKSILFKLACALKRRKLNSGDFESHQLTDKIFLPIQMMFGGRMKLLLVGSSPSIPEVLSFIKVVLGCFIIDGYGQTECCGASHSQRFRDMSVGNVGIVLPCCTMKLEDIPELKYFVKDGTGELCLKGYNIFRGYYKNPELSREVLDEEGWLHTGDIVSLCKDGSIAIIDRKNEIFKLSQGEYVVPGKLEKAYQTCEAVSQCFAYGDPYKNFTVAIVVPNRDFVLGVAKKKSITSSFEELCKNEVIISEVQNSMDRTASGAQLNGVERVRRIYLESNEFTVKDGMLTPTLKIRRGVCAKHFRDTIDLLYKSTS